MTPQLDLTVDFDFAFYTGVGASADVPAIWDVALNGRGYMLDMNHPAFGGQSAYLGRMGIETIPLVRAQADTSTEPGEGTINPEDLWPRSQTSWHKGAGQEYLDIDSSDRNRFHSSFGIDPWTFGQLKLLHDTESLHPSTNTNLALLRAGDYVYLADGTTLKWSQAPYSSWTNSVILNGESSASVLSIATDGHTVYAALGADGIHTTIRGASTSSHYSDLQATLVGYVKGRLMAAKDNVLYNVIGSGAAPTVLLTEPNTDWTWIGFAEGLGVLYAAGYSGDKSLIYSTAVKPDGTALAVPVVAGELPDGEIVRSIQGYLGFLIVGTDKGFRLATQDTSGNLTFGALVNTGSSVNSFEPQENFVWFGWPDFDDSHTGLGRMDLTVISNFNAPAYTTDLMAGSSASPTQGLVQSIVTEPGGKRIFSVAGVGIFIESNNLVASGNLMTGKLGFGMPDPKIALRFALKHKPLAEDSSVNVVVHPDDGAAVQVGTSAVVGSSSLAAPMKIPEVAAQLFEVGLTLTGDVVLERYDFRAWPVTDRGDEILIPILLHEDVITATGVEQSIYVREEYDAIKEYVGARSLVSYQELGKTYSVIVEDVDFQRHQATRDRSWWNGTLLLKLKVLGGE